MVLQDYQIYVILMFFKGRAFYCVAQVFGTDWTLI